MTTENPSVAARALLGSPKEVAILTSSLDAFSDFGYRKTSMEHIAKIAKVSRATLYLYFKNKEDVFRSLIEFHSGLASLRLADALKADGDIVSVLIGALVAIDGEQIEGLLGSPHADELWAVKSSIGGDLGSAGEDELCRQISYWIDRKIELGQVSTQLLGASSEEIARTICASKNGLKSQYRTKDEYLRGRDQIGQVFGMALEAK